MTAADQAVRVYTALAEELHRQGQGPLRDRFFVLAADAALGAGRTDEAERIRTRLLQHNPHHLLKPYTSFAEAAQSLDVHNYVAALRRNHSLQRAEELLAQSRLAKATRAEAASPDEDVRPSWKTSPGDSAGRQDGLRLIRAPETPAKNEVKLPPTRTGPLYQPSDHAAVPSPPAKPLSKPIPPGADGRSTGAGRLILPAHSARTPSAESADEDALELRIGAVVSWGLFAVVLGVGVLLVITTFFRALLPVGWRF